MLFTVVGFVVIFLLSWFGIGSAIIYIVNILRFQVPFTKTLVQEDICDKESRAHILATSWAGVALTLLVSGGLVIWLDTGNPSMGPIMTALGILVGLIRGRHIISFNLNSVRRFVRTHIACMNREKTAAFLQKNYDLSLDRLLAADRK